MGIKRFFHNLFHPFVALFGKIFGEVARHNFAVAAEALLESKLGIIVWDAVQWAATLTTDGAGKRQMAFDKIVKDAEAAALDFKDSIINLLIEVAVSKLKGNA